MEQRKIKAGIQAMKLCICHPTDLLKYREKLSKVLLTEEYFWEYKYDGVRTISWFDDQGLKIIAKTGRQPVGYLEMFSRNGRRLEALERFYQDKLHIPKGYVFDGELFDTDIHKTMSIVMSKNPTHPIPYYVFDMIPLDTIIKCKPYKIPYQDRKLKLFSNIMKSDRNIVKYVEFLPAKLHNENDIDRLISNAINQKYEGVVFKRKDSPYIPRRNILWIKGKRIMSLDLLVIDVIPSKEHQGMVQAIVCKLGNLKQPVGSGLTLEQRRRWYSHPDEIIGKIVEVKFAEYTKDGYLRQPTFVRIRYDKKVPDA